MAALPETSKSDSGVAGSEGASTQPIIIATSFVATVVEGTYGGAAMDRPNGMPPQASLLS